MQQRSKSSQLDREIDQALHDPRSSRRSHATKDFSFRASGTSVFGKAEDPRRQFIDAFLAMQHAFGQADEVIARVYNEAARSGGDKKVMAKLKAVTNRMEKALRDYSEEVDDLLSRLE